jgi:hypothetical protein
MVVYWMGRLGEPHFSSLVPRIQYASILYTIGTTNNNANHFTKQLAYSAICEHIMTIRALDSLTLLHAVTTEP